MVSFVFIGRCDGALSPFVWHLASLHDCIEYFGELTHTPITKVFECLSRYSIWSAALTILHFIQPSLYLFTCDFMQRTFGQWFVSAVNMLSCLVEQVPVILSPSTDMFFCVHEQGIVLCFQKVTLVVIFGCLVSRCWQPIQIAFSPSLVSNFSYNYCADLALSTATVLFASLFASL